MIIEALADVALREGLDAALSFPTSKKHVALRLNKSGTFTVEFKEDSPVHLPWAFNRTSGGRPNLLFDSEKRLRNAPGKKNKKGEVKMGIAHRDLSAELHSRWASKCPKHPAAVAVLNFFKRDMPALDLPKEYKDSSLVFYLKGDSRPICEIPEVYDAIAATLQEEFELEDCVSHYEDASQCVTRPHGKVSFRGLANPQALLGFNNDVTQAAGFSQGNRMLHAGMTYNTMRAYVGGLSYLSLNHALPTVPTMGGTLTYLGWSKTRHRMEELLKSLLKGCPKDTDARDWVALVRANLDDDTELLEDETPFYLLSVLCSNRIAVRGFHSMTVAELTKRLIAYFDDFSAITAKGPQRRVITPFGLLAPLLTPGMKQPSHPLVLVEGFYDALFTGSPYPQAMLLKAIKSFEEFVVDSAVKSNSQYPSTTTQVTMNAFMRREKNHMSDTLPENTNPFFVLGQLFAVFEDRNFRAKDEADRNMTSAQYKSFSHTPGRVLAILVERSEPHVAKLQSRRRYTQAKREWTHFQTLNTILGSKDVPMKTTPQERVWVARGRQHERQFLYEERILLKKQAEEKEEKAVADKKAKAENREAKLERSKKTKKKVA